MKNRYSLKKHVILFSHCFYLMILFFMLVTISEIAYADAEKAGFTTEKDEGKRVENLIDAKKYHIEEFRFNGNTVFSDRKLQKIAEPYKAEVGFDQLEELRNLISQYYVEHGYINSGAILKDQNVDQGIITYKIIEGRLSDIEIHGNKKLQTDYIKNRLLKGIGIPLNIYSLEGNVRLLHQDALIKRVNAEVKPGDQLGESVLVVDIVEEMPYQLGLIFSNDRSPSVGSYRGRVHAQHGNISGWGDEIDFWYGITEGMDDISVRYSIPFSSCGSSIGAYYERSDASVVEEPFDQIDIDSETRTWGMLISHPLIKRPDRSLSFSLSFERRENETTLLGYPYSFSPGAQDGKSEISVFRFNQDWIHQKRDFAFAARSIFSWGVDAFGPTTQNPDDPDGDFFSWLGQIQFAKRLGWLRDSQFIMKADVQLAPDPLLAMEKMTIGGASSVRGYRENQMVRDNGAVGSIELRVPIMRIPIPKITKSPEQGDLKLAVFFDWGWGENSEIDTPDPRTISSEGIGLLWDPSDKIHARIYWGVRNRNVDNPRNDIQDNGIHFLIDCRLF